MDYVSESAIVLCGGRSRRMGRDKAALPFGYETLISRVARLVGEVVGDVVLVARQGQVLPGGLEAVRDPAEGLGPLAGIAVGLEAVRGERAFVAACDMPLLRPAVVRRLLDLSEGYEAVVPLIDGFAMTTCAVYSRTTAALAAALVAERRLRPLFLVERVRTRYVGGEHFTDIDPDLESFRDCNTPERYAEALDRAGIVTQG